MSKRYSVGLFKKKGDHQVDGMIILVLMEDPLSRCEKSPI